MICCTRAESPRSCTGSLGPIETVISEPVALAFSVIMATHCSSSMRSENGADLSSIFPASIFEKSRTSSTRVASSVAQLLMESAR
jgi:hypothetical protein